MSAYVTDTETTGVSSTDEVIELAHLAVDFVNLKLKNRQDLLISLMHISQEDLFCQRYLPMVPVNPRAQEVHGIAYKDLLGKPKSSTIELPSMKYMVGHNISFDYRMLKKPRPEEIKLICTLDLSKKLVKFLPEEKYPRPENHQLTTLVKHFGGEEHFSVVGFHDAREDVKKTIFVLWNFIQLLPLINSWDELYEFQQFLKTIK